MQEEHFSKFDTNDEKIQGDIGTQLAYIKK